MNELSQALEMTNVGANDEKRNARRDYKIRR